MRIACLVKPTVPAKDGKVPTIGWVNMSVSVMSACKVHVRRDASVGTECSEPNAAGEWKTRPVAVMMLKCGCLRAENDGFIIHVCVCWREEFHDQKHSGVCRDLLGAQQTDSVEHFSW